VLSNILYTHFSPFEQLFFTYLPVVIVGILSIMMRRRLAHVLARPFGWVILLLGIPLAVTIVGALLFAITALLVSIGSSPSEQLFFIYLPVVIVGILAIMMQRRLAHVLARPFGWAILLLGAVPVVISIEVILCVIIVLLMNFGGHLG
jgi:hypothetical protein